ncbi:hypothetical protein [Caldicellulosiruptor morganii]|uniref:Lipoprotein n=1 Tax=Caldicellulosiruptor morganii TaxID=1387555 RepID=A0ABY7BKB7_9FIRM|nr:hypothetical protein [Caldicellulosiruptor morganii]WAM32767.1 hypothetical protein OTK00_001209 [Caldicellulosiruptor morganii]WAM32789.1 hypothetical protein OTK00_001235 [Caldicellulosiruptor morganii]
MKKTLLILIIILFIFAGVGACYYVTKYVLYDPVKTLKIIDPTIKIYFSSDETKPLGDNSYNGKKPDYKKHRIIEYRVVAANTGPRYKNCVLLIPLVPEEFEKKYVLKGGRDLIINLHPPIKEKIFKEHVYYFYTTEGDPQKVKEIISKYNKAKIIWEEGGKKYEKIIDMKVKILD